MKKYIIGIILGIVLCFGWTQAYAEPVQVKVDKLISDIKLVPEKVAYFVESEKLKTIAFQKDKWLEGQEQIKGTLLKIQSFFN